jgi:MFS family permease
MSETTTAPSRGKTQDLTQRPVPPESTTSQADPTAPAEHPRSLLRGRDFRLLWSAYSVSTIGSEVTVLAIPLAAAVLLGASPLQMGLLAAAGTAPYVGFALIVGAWIDRLPRRRPLLIAADLVAAAALFTVPLAWLTGVLTVTQLIAVELVVGVARVTFRPAFGAHLPDVVPERAITRASSRLRAAEATAMLVGPGLGGSLVQLLTAPIAVLVDAVSFLVSATLIGKLRAPERVGHVPPPRRRMRQEIGEGLSLLWRDRRLRAIAGAAANVNFFGLMVFALLVVYLTREQNFPPVMIAAVTVAGGLGSLAGAILAPRVADRIGRGRTILLGSAVFGLGMIAFPAAHGPRWLVLAVLAANEVVAGAAIMLFDVNTSALVLMEVPRDMLARVNSSLSTVTQGVKALGAVSGGALGTAFGLRPALWVAAVGATTTVLWTWFSPLRDRDPSGPGQRSPSAVPQPHDEPQP